MNHFEIEDALSTFRIIVDTREQETPKAADRYKSFGVPYERRTLDYCDYCGDITLPGQKSLYLPDASIKARCVIERKMNLDELAGCFTRGRDRFEREFERAVSNNARVFLLVENASWEAIYAKRYRSKFTPKAFTASLVAWSIRYGITPIFCKADTSGKVIKEILYRDMKERLERGELG